MRTIILQSVWLRLRSRLLRQQVLILSTLQNRLVMLLLLRQWLRVAMRIRQKLLLLLRLDRRADQVQHRARSMLR